MRIGPERETNSDIEAAELFTLPFMVVLPKGQRHAGAGALAGPSAQPLTPCRGNLPICWSATRAMPPATCSRTCLSAIVHDLGAGAGARYRITLCMLYARLLVEQNGLVMRPLVHPQVQRSFWIFTRKGRSLSPAAQGFLDFARGQLARVGVTVVRVITVVPYGARTVRKCKFL